MKKTHKALLAVVVILSGVLMFRYIGEKMNDNTMVQVVDTLIENQELSFSFNYPSGENAYTLVEPPVTEAISGDLKKIYLLFNTESYVAYQNDSEANTPLSVSVFVFALPETDDELSRSERLLAWADEYPLFSSIKTKTGEVDELKLDGAQAVHYVTNGSYKQSVYLVLHRGHIYVLNGQYEKDGDDMNKMFSDLVASLVFN